MSRILHMALDIEGFLSNSTYPRDFQRMFKHDDGRSMTPQEARAELFRQIRMGRRLLPMTTACEGFDYDTGCPGHDEESRDDISQPFRGEP